jgi:colanic acid/amylovoran biosynthesis protein
MAVKKIDLIGHFACFNRGCEAIVRSTLALLRDAGIDCRFRLFSRYADRDRVELHDSLVEVLPAPWDRSHQYNPRSLPRRAISWIRRYAYQPSLLAEAAWNRVEWIARSPRIRSQTDIALSIGGDNFSLDYGILPLCIAELEHYRRCGVKTAIWGASIGPFTADPSAESRAAQFLSSVDLITAREQVTRDYLQTLGVKGNVVPVWDPAFYLQPAEHQGPATAFLEKGGITGLNISALIARWCPGQDMELMLDEVARFVSILVGRGERVLLVPHVTNPGGPLCDNDEAVLSQVRERVKYGKERIALLPGDLPVAEIKWVISKCHLFMAARTHATIAAVSTGVPTVAIAYSIKARGIWRDIFDNDDLVLPTNQLTSTELLAKWELLSKGEHILRQHLKTKHGEMLAGAKRNAEALKSIL